MRTQLELAKEGRITPQMKAVAIEEGFSVEVIRERLSSGEIVIPCNPNRALQKVVGIGTGLRTKVNASIGTSSDICDVEAEIRKAIAAEEEGADTLMELSAGGDLDAIRRAVLAHSNLPAGYALGRSGKVPDVSGYRPGHPGKSYAGKERNLYHVR